MYIITNIIPANAKTPLSGMHRRLLGRVCEVKKAEVGESAILHVEGRMPTDETEILRTSPVLTALKTRNDSHLYHPVWQLKIGTQNTNYVLTEC